MARKSIKVEPKKRGRPATGKDPLVGVRLPPATIKAIDEWAKTNSAESRSEAIRRLIGHGIKATTPLRVYAIYTRPKK